MGIKRKKPGPEPVNVAAKPQAYIEDWQEFDGCLVGTVSRHPRQGEFHAHSQITSPIVSLDRAAGRAETANTVYVLGREVRPLM